MQLSALDVYSGVLAVTARRSLCNYAFLLTAISLLEKHQMHDDPSDPTRSVNQITGAPRLHEYSNQLILQRECREYYPVSCVIYTTLARSVFFQRSNAGKSVKGNKLN